MFADRVENSGDGGVFSHLSGKFRPKCILETGKAIKGWSILVWCLLSPVVLVGGEIACLAGMLLEMSVCLLQCNIFPVLRTDAFAFTPSMWRISAFRWFLARSALNKSFELTDWQLIFKHACGNSHVALEVIVVSASRAIVWWNVKYLSGWLEFELLCWSKDVFSLWDSSLIRVLEGHFGASLLLKAGCAKHWKPSAEQVSF